jgi:beta-glucosidase
LRSHGRLSVVAAVLAVQLLVAAPAASADPPEDDLGDGRVEELLARMTLAEKVGQMTLIDLSRLMGSGRWDRGPLSSEWLERVLVDCHVGAILSGGNAAPQPSTPARWAETAAALQAVARDRTRLGIPLLYGVDAVHGHNAVVGATLYPHNLGLAASWDPDLVEAVARATARDVRATGLHWTFAPVADVARDPRWGRYYETFGEDPLLVSTMVAAAVRGLQGDGLASPGSVAATVKHFVGYGGAEAGRDRFPAWIPERALRRIHLPPFRAGIDAGAATLMVDSGSVNGVPVHGSRQLLTDLLRDELGFQGIVVSDWNDVQRLQEVHGVAADPEAAVALAIDAGIDMVMVPHDAEGFTAVLRGLVERGRIGEDRIDDSVRRILHLKDQLGLFGADDPEPTAAERVLAEADRTLALDAATASLTLLTNRGVLPITGGDLLLVGAAADDPAMQLGGWTVGWQGIADRSQAPGAVTLRAGLEGAVAAPAHVQTLASGAAEGALRRAARRADVVIVALGERPYAEFEGDAPDPLLPAEQAALVRTVAATGTPTVVVLFAGRPLVLPADVVEAADAILMAYLPGDQGGVAVARVLLGQAEPGGRLPFSWPASVGQLPITADRPPTERAPEPLFPLGHGLSFGRVRIALGEPRVEGDTILLPVRAENVADRPAREVVRAIVERDSAPVMAPAAQLVAFEAITLAAGESRSWELRIPLSRLAVWSGDVFDVGELVVPPGRYRVRLGETVREFSLP